MKKRIKGKLILVLILAVLCIGYGVKELRNSGALSVSARTETVQAKELAGYLRVIPLTPDETRKLILPKLNEVLTGRDVRILFEELNLSACYEDICKKEELADDKPITRGQWSAVYEAMLDKLGMEKEVSEAEIQYLGDVAEEDRIIADSGNYDCDLESSSFTYGKEYTVYLYGNFILGKKEGTVQNETAVKEEKTPEKEKETSGKKIDVPEQVRVLITQDNGKNAYRSGVWVKGSGKLKITSGKKRKMVAANKTVNCKKLLENWKTSALTIDTSESGKLYLTNSNGKAQSSGYRGSFQVYKNKSGCWVVNELDLEAYLYGVVPGEMPESFAPEALKAQAVCARTYACSQIQGRRYEGYKADLDDTTDCQVYQTSGENEKAKQAVDATKGKVLTKDGAFARIYYFSTSCGRTSGMEVWGEEGISNLKGVSLLTGKEKKQSFEKFIQDQKVKAYDSESRYFRWKAVVDIKGRSKALRNVLKTYAGEQGKDIIIRNKKNKPLSDVTKLGTCRKMTVKERTDSGTVTDLMLQFSGGTVHIYNENVIRTVLHAAVISLKDKNGNSADAITMLPSAAFVAERQKKGRYLLYGGGLGHGVGMSQYGADGMARAGLSYEKILEKFFAGTTVTTGN